MKIKKTRQVRLDELMKYVLDNNAYGLYKTVCGRKNVYIREDLVRFHEYIILTEELFTITEEVEITEELPLDLVEVYVNNSGRLQCNANEHITIRRLLQENNLVEVKTKFIYLQNEDGSIGELIWEDGELIG